MAFQGVPNEIVHGICYELWLEGDEKTLKVIALTSKRCFSIAKEYLFRNLRLDVDRVYLTGQVSKKQKRFEKHAELVRALSIHDGSLPSQVVGIDSTSEMEGIFYRLSICPTYEILQRIILPFENLTHIRIIRALSVCYFHDVHKIMHQILSFPKIRGLDIFLQIDNWFWPYPGAMETSVFMNPVVERRDPSSLQCLSLNISPIWCIESSEAASLLPQYVECLERVFDITRDLGPRLLKLRKLVFEFGGLWNSDLSTPPSMLEAFSLPSLRELEIDLEDGRCEPVILIDKLSLDRVVTLTLRSLPSNIPFDIISSVLLRLSAIQDVHFHLARPMSMQEFRGFETRVITAISGLCYEVSRLRNIFCYVYEQSREEYYQIDGLPGVFRAIYRVLIDSSGGHRCEKGSDWEVYEDAETYEKLVDRRERLLDRFFCF